VYQRIVVPLDGAELAEIALAHGAHLAGLLGAELHLLRVVDVTRLERYGPYGLALEYASYEQVLTTESATARAYLSTLSERLRSTGLHVTDEIRSGVVSREVIAATAPGDLIVMASHGRAGVKRWFLGSVAEDVVRHATVPVMLIRAGEVPATLADPAAKTQGG
jgi:nucleotide-binding universal stress UspA family protein